MATDLCFQCRKVSLAYGQREDKSIPWIHSSTSDLYMVLKGKDTIVRNGELTMRIFQGNRVMEDVELGAYVDLALRAQADAEQAGIKLGGGDLPIFLLTKAPLLAIRYVLKGKPRRIQLNMQSDAECQRIVDILRQRGMNVLDQIVRNDRPGTNYSITGAAGARSTLMEPPSTQHVAGHNTTTKSFSQSDNMAKKAASTSIDFGMHAQVATTNESPARRLGPDKNAIPNFLAPAYPNTSQMYRSHTMFSASSPMPTAETLNVITAGDGAGMALRQQRSSAPSGASNDSFHSLSSEKAAEPRSAMFQPGSRPGSSALTLPPLPQPNIIKETSSPSTIQADATLRIPVSERNLNQIIKPSLRTGEATAKFQNRKQLVAHKSLPESADAQSAGELPHRCQSPAEILRKDKVRQGSRDIADAAQEIVPPPVSLSRHVTNPSLSGQSLILDRLESYASDSPLDREAALEEFMVAHIENASFAELCEDVENSWRRIALGL